MVALVHDKIILNFALLYDLQKFRTQSLAVRSLFDEVQKLLKLAVVIPASSTSAERSFSSLRRLKTYLRAKMSQERLNHVCLLHVHQDRLDSLKTNDLQKAFLQ